MAKFENRQYKLLFQVKLLALFAAGIATVELSVIAFNVAGNDASALLGTALTLKSLTYVIIPLMMAAIFARLPRGRFLMSLDIIRALALLGLIFVRTETSFLIAVTVFLSATAAFSITYLEYVSHLLPESDDFAWAMSKSRIADELEGVISPLVAALLLFLLPVDSLLLLSAAIFAVSAFWIWAAKLPDLSGTGGALSAQRAIHGIRIFQTRRELRPMVWLMIAVAAGTAVVMTGTPYIVQSIAGLSPSATAIAYGAFGAGAILGAVGHVRLRGALRGGPEMSLGGVLVVAGLFGGITATRYETFLALWVVIGAGVSLIRMPAAEVIREAGEDEGFLTAFGGGYAMQNAILAVAYILAGALAATAGTVLTFAVMGGVSAAAVLLARKGLRRPGPGCPAEFKSET